MSRTTTSAVKQPDDPYLNYRLPLVQAILCGVPLLFLAGSPTTTTTNSTTTVLSSLSSAPGIGQRAQLPSNPLSGRIAQGQTDRVRRIYHTSGLSWDELGRVLGVSRRTVHNWANGFRMSSRHVVLLGQFDNLVQRYAEHGPESVRVALLTPDEDGVSPYTSFLREASPAPQPGRLSVEDLLGTIPSA